MCVWVDWENTQVQTLKQLLLTAHRIHTGKAEQLQIEHLRWELAVPHPHWLTSP